MFGIDILYPNWDKLPGIAQAYIRPLVEDIDYYKKPTATSLCELILSPSKIPGSIVESHRSLSQYEVIPETATNPRVKAGHQILNRFFQEKTQYMQDNRIVVGVYGSLRYDDPQSLDYDLIFLDQMRIVK